MWWKDFSGKSTQAKDVPGGAEKYHLRLLDSGESRHKDFLRKSTLNIHWKDCC